MDIRKISIGPDYKSSAMHYLIGQEVLGGKYFIQGTVTGDYGSVGQDGEETVASLYKNGSSIQLATIRTSSSATGTGRVITTVASTIQDLSASDTIELYALTTDASGDNAKVKGEMTTLLGYKLIG